MVLWGWLRSYTPDYTGQKGELFAVEEVGKLLDGKQEGDYVKSHNDPTDANPVPVSLKTHGAYISQTKT